MAARAATDRTRAITNGFPRQLLARELPAEARSLPATSLGDTQVAERAVLNALAGTLDVGVPYPLPTASSMPSPETTPSRPPVPN